MPPRRLKVLTLPQFDRILEPTDHMIPSHGAATSTFNLLNTLRYEEFDSASIWIQATSERSSFLSAAIDHSHAANFLLSTGLVVLGEPICVDPRLPILSARADGPTLRALASVILEAAPPPWLKIAVVDRVVREEFIPDVDLRSLEWLQPDLQQILLTAFEANLPENSLLALGIGRAAELVVFRALEALNRSPLHVSRVSDRFGYDIETPSGFPQRWEVKGATVATSRRFHLSRNEYDKSRIYGDAWVLVQVVFTPQSVLAEEICYSHVSEIRAFSWNLLRDLAPSDEGHFRWEASAVFSPPSNLWQQSQLLVPENLKLQGFEELGRLARGERLDR